MGLSIINSIAPRGHVDTYFADVKKLSSDSAAALEHSLLAMKHVEEQVMNQSPVNPVHDQRGAPTIGPRNESGGLDRVENLRFQIQMHGYQCLVHTLQARKFTPSSTNDVTWVTQFTTDRLNIFRQMLERWSGPVSVALYTQNLEADLREIAPFRDRVDFHLVGASQGLYPVNTLRNVALDNSRTDFVILADVDFVPSAGIHEYVIRNLAEWGKDTKKLYVFPAFEIDGTKQDVPTDKAALKAMGARIHQVHNDKGRDIAHKYTDYARWADAAEPYAVDYKFPYEPYFLAPRTIPRYDVRFFGYGNDKASHGYELNAAGYTFMVAPEAFVVHVPHPQGAWVQASFVDPKDRLSKTLTTFLSDVDRRYARRVKTNEDLVLSPLPPSAAYEAAVGQLGASCTLTCKELGKACRAEWAERINMCKELEKRFTCTYGCNDNFFGSDLPAFNTQREQCLINVSPVANPFHCDSVYPYSRRLCPCGSSSF